MLVVLPVHRGDANLAIRTLELSAQLEFITNHQLLIAFPQDIGPALRDVIAAGQKAFEVVREYPIPHAVPNTWPQGPNKMFASVVDYIRRKFDFDAKSNPHEYQPFLWMEPDLVMLHKGYLDRISTEYRIGGKPCLGKIVPTVLYDVLERETDENGRVGKPKLLGEKRLAGYHMVGAGVYDRGIRRLITWVDSTVHMEQGFDVALQGEILQRDGTEYTRATSSELIAHYPKSINYRITQKGDFVEVACDAHADAPTKDPFKFSRMGHAGPCMVHGCKDDTLHQIVEYAHGLREDCPMDIMEVRSVESVQIGSSTENSEVEALRKQIEELKAMVQQSAAPKKEKKQKPKKSRPEINEKEVWETYLSILNTEGSGAAWTKTISKHKVTPTQLKVIRDKNTIPA